MGGQTIEAVVFKTLGAAVRVIGTHMVARGIVMMAGGVAEGVGNRFQIAELGVSKAGSFAGTIGIAHQLAVGIVVVLMLTWLVGVSPRLTHIKEADAQTAQIEESNKKTRDQIETLRMASETIGLQKDRLRQLQRQIPDGYNQNEFIDSLNAAADGAGVSIQSVTFDEATTAEVPSEMQGTIKAGRLVQVPVSITANGSYDAMRGFVQAVQGINRIAVPEDVTYTLDKGGDATKNNVTINCKIWSLLLNNDTVEDENVTKQ